MPTPGSSPRLANLRTAFRWAADHDDLDVAATITGFAHRPITTAAQPEIGTAITQLREVLGDPTYDALARKGKAMTTTEIVTYPYDQIDQARTELNAVSNRP